MVSVEIELIPFSQEHNCLDVLSMLPFQHSEITRGLTQERFFLIPLGKWRYMLIGSGPKLLELEQVLFSAVWFPFSLVGQNDLANICLVASQFLFLRKRNAAFSAECRQAQNEIAPL